MVEIIPAIIPEDFQEIEDKASMVVGLAKTLQIDVLDGEFVPDKSWPYKTNMDPDFEMIKNEEKPLPYFDKFNYEFDLMVDDPTVSMDAWMSAGAARIIVHTESFSSTDELSQFISDFNSHYISDGSLITTELGVAININTPVKSIEPILNEVAFVQCMGIKKIGYQGQPFDKKVLDQINSLRELKADLIISIDGGVKEDTAPLLVKAGANRLVVGSAIFGSNDPGGVIEILKRG